jgi:flagellar motor switch protein FliG
MAAPQPVDRVARSAATVRSAPILASSRFDLDQDEADDEEAEQPEDRPAAIDGFVSTRGVSEIAKPAPAGPFASFHDAEAKTLLDSIRDEHPQTVALVLAHLPHAKAGEILAGLPAAKQVEVVKRIAGIEQTSSEVIEQVEQGLRQRLGHIIGRTIRSGGVSAVAEILNSADRRTEREILHSLDHDAPGLADQIRRVQSVFDDLLHAPDQDIRAIVEQLDAETIAMALRTARERLVRKVLWNLPAEEAAQIERDLQSVEPVLISEIEAAQHRVAEVVERLNTTGEISVLEKRRRREGRKGETV